MKILRAKTIILVCDHFSVWKSFNGFETPVFLSRSQIFLFAFEYVMICIQMGPIPFAKRMNSFNNDTSTHRSVPEKPYFVKHKLVKRIWIRANLLLFCFELDVIFQTELETIILVCDHFSVFKSFALEPRNDHFSVWSF